jgi:hypothetical protein
VRILKDDFAARKMLSLDKVMLFPHNEFLSTDAYGWSWAAAFFLDHHPATAEKFRQLQANVADRSVDFSKNFYDGLQDEWPAIAEDWQLFVAEADYGYDVARAAVVRQPSEPLPEKGMKLKITADHGWQSTGIRLEANETYTIYARGRYQVGKTDQIWWCEPNGVTIHYHNNLPLGVLLAGLSEVEPPPDMSHLLRPSVIGLANTVKPPVTGTLYLKINEAAAKLADNAGEIEIAVFQGNKLKQ